MASGIVNMKGVTVSDGDVKTGDGRSRTSVAQAEGRTGPKAGKAHVAEWRRGGAKRVLGDVGRGEGSLPRAAQRIGRDECEEVGRLQQAACGCSGMEEE